jgi:hypothetical protein
MTDLSRGTHANLFALVIVVATAWNPSPAIAQTAEADIKLIYELVDYCNYQRGLAKLYLEYRIKGWSKADQLEQLGETATQVKTEISHIVYDFDISKDPELLYDDLQMRS